MQEELATHFPDWAQISVAYMGTYLGVDIGPASIDGFWTRPIKKYLDRAKQWGSLGLGLQYAAVAYLVYVLPVLSFLAQFRDPDDNVRKAEERALALMVPGPYRWCVLEDYFHLAELYGQTVSFPRLDHVCLAAKARLFCLENRARGGLDISGKTRRLQRAVENASGFSRYTRWFTWYYQGILAQIAGATDQLETRGLDLKALMRKAAGQDLEGRTTSDQRARRKKTLQRTIRKSLDEGVFVDAVERMRQKLDRWHLEGLPGRTAPRCVAALRALKSLVRARLFCAPCGMGGALKGAFSALVLAASIAVRHSAAIVWSTTRFAEWR